ncbi:MAG TPA: DUF4349 domain-containing protein [Candidatus Dormibacteraeota bacterium]|nr:DUF4349 domain-containing protein [Candidatus Dormibacteraeota bacterium]
MKKVLVIVAILVAAAACGGASSTGSGAGSPFSSQSGRGGSVDAQAPSKSASAPNGTTTAGGSTTVPATTVPVLQGPPVIRQAQLSITVGSGTFASKLSEVRHLVEAAGGFIAGTDATASPAAETQNSQLRTGVINFMVPADRFDATIDELSGVGKVQSEHIAGQDVSAQYVDLRARLANAEAQRNAMLALLARAQNISDIIAVQNQLGQITAQIEQFKGQIKYLDDNTSYSSVSVTLTESGAPTQAAPSDSWGFATALNDAAHNFMTTVNYAVSGLGALGPFILLGGLGYLIWRRRRTPVARRA